MRENPQILVPGRYHVVPRTLILIFNDRNVLLQKGASTKKIWAGKYNGFGGHIERDEDVLSSARRELFEETGLICPDLRLYGTVMIDVNESEGILMFVLCGWQPQGTLQGSDEGAPKWVDIADVSTLPVVEDITMLIEKITRMNVGEVFHGHYGYSEIGNLIADFN
jgi:8-oxo-dGTP diphosphatase